MMQVWIVWGDKPIAVFSSEERARQYIARKGSKKNWICSPAEINPEGLSEMTQPRKRPSADRAAFAYC